MSYIRSDCEFQSHPASTIPYRPRHTKSQRVRSRGDIFYSYGPPFHWGSGRCAARRRDKHRIGGATQV